MGTGLLLQFDASSNLAIAQDGTFRFAGDLTNGAAYNVTVKRQPVSPNQTCSVTNGVGTIRDANVSNVSILCVVNSYEVNGTVSGLETSGLSLQLNGTQAVSVSANGPFSFKPGGLSGQSYAVTIATQPSDAMCSVQSGTGTISDQPITNIAVACASTLYKAYPSAVGVNDIAWDPHSKQLYLALSSLSTIGANTITAFDPITGTIGKSAFVGSEPISISVSDDAQFIYVGFAGEQTVKRFLLPDLTPDFSLSTIRFNAGGANSSDAPTFALQVKAAPGAPHTWGVLRFDPQLRPSVGALFVNDDAISRWPDMIAGPSGGAFDWADDASRLFCSFGTTFEGPPTTFVKYALALQGQPTVESAFLQLPVAPTPFRYANGRLHTDAGPVLNASTGDVLGRYDPPGALAVDTLNGKTFTASVDSYGTATLESFDLATLAPLKTLHFPLRIEGFAAVKKLIRWGPDGLAVVLENGVLDILSGAFVAPGGTSIVGMVPTTGQGIPVFQATQAQALSNATDIAWSTTRGELYASVPSTATEHPSSIAVVQPTSGAVTRYVALTFNPGTLAVSSDGQYLYVSSPDDKSVRRLVLPQMQADQTIPLDGVAKEIAVAPGAPHTVIVSLIAPSTPGALRIFDDANTRYPTVVPAGTWAEWGDSDARLYTFDNDNTGFQLWEYSVSATAATVLNTTPRAVSYRFYRPFYTTFKYAGGLVYSDVGAVWNPATRGIVGTMQVPAPGPVAVDSAHHRAFFAVGTQILSYDTVHYTPVMAGSIFLTGNTTRLLQTGPSSFALHTDAGAVIVLNDSRLGI